MPGRTDAGVQAVLDVPVTDSQLKNDAELASEMPAQRSELEKQYLRQLRLAGFTKMRLDGILVDIPKE